MANTTDPRPTLGGEPSSRPVLYGPSRAGGGVRPLLGRASGQIGRPGPGMAGLSRFWEQRPSAPIFIGNPESGTVGRTTKNTRAFPLGQFVGMGRRMTRP